MKDGVEENYQTLFSCWETFQLNQQGLFCRMLIWDNFNGENNKSAQSLNSLLRFIDNDWNSALAQEQ